MELKQVMKEEVICWDSSVMISWIGGDTHEINKERMPAIQATMRSLERGDYKLTVSAILYVEILEITMPPEAIEKFEQVMRRKEMIGTVAVNIPVAKKAQAIRNQTKLNTPDAIQVATAIISNAKYFHTFDKKLLKLNGKDEVEGLAITPCTIHEIHDFI